MADPGTGPEPQLPGAHSHYFFGRNADDRQRLACQFSLLREDFNMWLDDAIRLAGLPAEPGLADWSVLDLGCGEGQYAHEIARRYPNARVTGMDSDTTAITAASAATPPDASVRFLVHDARQPVPSWVVPGGGFNLVVAWMLLLHLPDKAAALASMAACLAPGGVALLGNIPDEPVWLDHPDALAINKTGRPALEQLGLLGLEDGLGPLLAGAGFTSITTAVLRYPLGGATSYGRRWYDFALTTLAAGQSLLAATGLMDPDEYQRHLDALANAPILDQSGEQRFLVTLARRA
jgi:SAM-dependent methyltransferase